MLLMNVGPTDLQHWSFKGGASCYKIHKCGVICVYTVVKAEKSASCISTKGFFLYRVAPREVVRVG